MDRKKLINSLIIEEGIRLRPYKDSKGILTIGVGRNLQRGISLATALQMLDEDINEAVTDLMAFDWFRGLDDVRQRVLVDMRFNLGPDRFRGFKNMLKALERKDYHLASIEMLSSEWSKDVKGRATKLAQMMETGTDA